MKKNNFDKHLCHKLGEDAFLSFALKLVEGVMYNDAS
jgi:ArsR family metal-binding transcriptional regulator